MSIYEGIHLIIYSSRVARDFLVSARRGEEVVAYATATKPQRSGTRKYTQPFGIRSILRDRFFAPPRSIDIHLVVAHRAVQD